MSRVDDRGDRRERDRAARHALRDERQAARRERHREQRRARRERRAPPEDPLEAAEERAAAKARVVREATHYALVVGLLAIFVRPAAWIVALVWGVGLARQLSRHFVEPELRRRWVDREVHHRLDRTVRAERREIETRHSRHMESLAAGVAHEIRNPITAAKSLVQQMGEDPASGENVEYARVALDELNRVERSISHLLRFAREEDVQPGDVDLEEVVASAVESFRDRLERDGVEVKTRYHAPGDLRADSEQLRRVLINLVGNALDALEGAKTPSPRIEIEAGRSLGGSEAWLCVRDNGPGLPEDARDKLFSPFFSTKGEGTGLGLALSRKIVEAHGGTLEAGTAPEGGSEFLITLPRDAAAEGRRS